MHVITVIVTNIIKLCCQCLAVVHILDVLGLNLDLDIGYPD
jgi:hypothetical protein